MDNKECKTFYARFLKNSKEKIIHVRFNDF